MLTLHRLFGIVAAVLAAFLLAPGNARCSEPAAISETAVDRMIGLNKQAYTDILDQHFQAAKYWLSKALVISETAGLENDEMTARTYVHLAVVSLTGLKDREEAVQQFMLALRINPNITITHGLESPALKSAYLEAREQMGLPPNPDTTVPLPSPPLSPPAPPNTQAKVEPMAPSGAASPIVGIEDPDPPASVPSPLYCRLPMDTPPGKDVVVRCLTQKQQRRSSATFHYRPSGSEGEFAGLPMGRTPKGWLAVVVPGRAIHGKSLSYYVKAEIPGTSDALYLGHPEAPDELIIRKPSSPERAKDATGEPGSAAGAAAATAGRSSNTAPSRFRAPGSIWISLGAGTGAVYHGREVVDETPVHVQAGFSFAALFQLEPENRLSGEQAGVDFSHGQVPVRAERRPWIPDSIHGILRLSARPIRLHQ